MGFVYCNNPLQLRKKLKRLLKREHKKRYPPSLQEIKFYLPKNSLINKGYTPDQIQRYENELPSIRKKVIQHICNEATGVFGAILDKKKARDAWTSERIGNFIFAQTLVVNVMNQISPQYPVSILYDEGRLPPAQKSKFKQYLTNKDQYFRDMKLNKYEGKLPTPQEVNSCAEAGIWAADIVAGAFQYKYKHKDAQYAELLAPVYICNGERLYW